MKIPHLSAVSMAAGLIFAGVAFAETPPAQKQRTQEGGASDAPCALPFNANPSADPDCKQRTQNMTPSGPNAAYDALKNNK